MKSLEEQAAGSDIDQISDAPDGIDQYDEPGDYANGYLTVSSNKATQPPALCLNTEEVTKVFDEGLAYLIFQRKDLLDDYVALSFNEMKERHDERKTPFVTKPFHCPAFLDAESKLPRVPAKDEYFEWIRGEGRKEYQATRDERMNHYTNTRLATARCLFEQILIMVMRRFAFISTSESETYMFGPTPP